MIRKGQAAVEFLMTYGWAILAAVIAIGVLAYFGVFSPGKFITGSAVVTAPFYVNAWNVQAAPAPGEVNLELRNNGGEDYLLYSLTISGCGTLTPASPQSVAAGSTTPFAIQCAVPPLTAALAAGGTFKGDITINYRKIGSSVDLTSTGTLAEKITA